ncbi:hypothetical protein SK128_000353 [Halocaridina rubra]|uniref:PH domain-containing protein n=1 Tax=Halocaridina rubra TaxID=373956 RepID=A0AAN8WGV5_HALRR
MCEMESSGVTGNGISYSGERLNLSCPEGITENKKNSLDEKTNGEEIVAEENLFSEDLEARRGSVGTRDPTPRNSKSFMEDDKGEVEGVDPFSALENRQKDSEETTHNHLPMPSTPVSMAKQREGKGPKSVNFKDPEIKKASENGTTNDTLLTHSTSSNGSHKEDGAVKKRPLIKQRSLGDTNPVYRLSMKLSPNLFNIQEIPGASQHREVEKVGYLTKLSGRSFPYIPQWKRRYCVLAKGRLYYYEREDSKSGDKSNGVINLEYFDQVSEAAPKDCKKATNVFIITSQDRSFFDPGRHLFSADTLPDMKDWVRKLQTALEQIRNNSRPPTSSATSTSKKDGAGKKGKEGLMDNKDNKGIVQNSAKDRKKKKDSHRPRKSARVGDGPETPSQEMDSTSPAPNREAEFSPVKTSVGVQLPGSPRGIQLPGMSARKDLTQNQNENKEMKSTENQLYEDGLPAMGPTLNCVTKLRVKGPQGRRIPQNTRRNVAATALKKRASSLSALEYQDLNNTSEAPWLNRSVDMLDETASPKKAEFVGGVSPALPYKAYNYSSDEEIDDDGEHSQSDSFPTSAAAMPPPPPPRSASYGLEVHRHPQLGQLAGQVLHRSLGDSQEPERDVRGSKRSLGNRPLYGLDQNEWLGSHGSLGQNGEILGTASPVMDDLDNLLMNQSVQHTSLIMNSASESESEGSTCRPSDRPNQHHEQQMPSINYQASPKHSKRREKSGSHLNRFAVAIKHLQRHVVDIDRAVFGITGEVSGVRQEVTNLKEAVLALQADTDTITSTLSHLTQEAISAQQKISFASQEAERVRQVANVALKEAEQAKQEQQRVKREYESLCVELRSVLRVTKDIQTSSLGRLKSINKSITNKEPDILQSQVNQARYDQFPKPNEDTKPLDSNFKPAEECNMTSSPKSKRASNIGTANSSSNSRASCDTSSGAALVSKSNSFSQIISTPKVPAYQSLFTRPSSLISGLTYRASLTKSVSFADQRDMEKAHDKNQEKNMQRENEDKKKMEELHQSTLERLEKKESKHNHKGEDKDMVNDTATKERNKEKKAYGSIERRDKKHRHSSKDKKNHLRENKEAEHMISNLSLEDDIPMVDASNELLDKARSSDNKPALAKLTKLSNSTQTPSNFSLGKSSSSPVVSPSLSKNRPRILPLTKDIQKGEICNSNASTPESSVPPISPPQALVPYQRPTSPYSRSSTALQTVDENNVIRESSSSTSLHRPGSTPGPLARQGSMTTVPEDRAVVGPPPSRPGVFAISRQSSTPNIPLQRQNSGSSIPLQRQHSLGVVPGEGRLLRQESLMSVPEDRPLVDQTLPLSPSASMSYFSLSPSVSASGINEAARRAAQATMELVTGPVLAGSSMQEASATGTLAVLASPDEEAKPTATSTLKKDQKPQMDVDGVVI